MNGAMSSQELEATKEGDKTYGEREKQTQRVTQIYGETVERMREKH